MAVLEARRTDRPDDLYLTSAEVASMLRKSVETLANERSRGEGLPFVKLGGKVLYRMADVMRVINEGVSGFTWARLEASLQRYGLDEREAGRLVAHLKRDM